MLHSVIHVTRLIHDHPRNIVLLQQFLIVVRLYGLGYATRVRTEIRGSREVRLPCRDGRSLLSYVLLTYPDCDARWRRGWWPRTARVHDHVPVVATRLLLRLADRDGNGSGGSAWWWGWWLPPWRSLRVCVHG
jgi:hypothetical protein